MYRDVVIIKKKNGVPPGAGSSGMKRKDNWFKEILGIQFLEHFEGFLKKKMSQS